MKCAFRSVLFSIFIFFVGCGEFVVDDKEIVDNNRTQDITFDNAEELVWNAFHGAGTTFRQSELQNGLDASFFGSQAGVHNCAGGGEISYQYSAAPGDVHQTGDTLSLEYTDCIKANGNTFNGQISGRYTEVEGYNDAFTGLTMDQCVARVADKETVTALVIDDQAETVVFERQGAKMYVRYRSAPNGLSGPPVDQAVYETLESDRTLVINRAPGNYDSVDASDGALLYFVDGFEAKPIDCKYAKRTIDLDVKGLRVQGKSVFSTLDSSLELRHYFRNSNNQDLSITSDLASVVLVKVGHSVSLDMRTLVFRMDYDVVGSSTAGLEYSGEMNVSGDSGVVDYFNLISFSSAYDRDVASSGQFRIRGEGTERVTMNVDSDVTLRFSVSTEGEPVPVFSNSWTDFLDRNFVRPAP
jgi:hypothetical protein